MPNLTGQSVGRYHILEQLGEGGMATVYKAYDTRLERNVAFKVLRTDLFGQAVLEQVLKRFEREAKSLAKLKHSNIVNILDFGEHEGMPYLVMEYLPGGTLKQKLGQKIPWQEVIKTLIPVARGLAYAHQHNIIHRDVKPANVLIDENNTPVLTDFGIAKLLEGTDGHTLTASGVGIGTPEYMAPEQGIGASTIDARADIYSLGIVLYEMVTGRKPYIADTPMAVVLKQMTDPLPRPTDFVPDLPEGVERILLKALAKEPDDRYTDMNVLISAMEDTLAETKEIEAPVPATPTPTKRKKKKAPPRAKPSPKVIMAILGVVAVILVVGFGAPWVMKQFSTVPKAEATSIKTIIPAPITTPTSLQFTKTLEPSPTPIYTQTPIQKTTQFIEPIQSYIETKRPSFEDDFSTVRLEWGSIWNGDGFYPIAEVRRQDDSLRISGFEYDTLPRSNLLSAKDFVIRYDLALNNTQYIDFVFRESPDATTSYAFRYNNGGNWQFIYKDGPATRTLKQGIFTPVSGSENNYDPFKSADIPLNNFQVIVWKENLAIFVNDKLILDFNELTLNGEKSFFKIIPGDPVKLDNFKFWNLSGEEFSTSNTSPTPDATASGPTWITDFAEPILSAIKDREPYFQDDFSTDEPKGWYVSDMPGEEKPLSIEEGVLRLTQGGKASNIYLRQKPNFILQVDITPPASCCVTMITNSEGIRIHLGPDEICMRDECREYSRLNNQKIQITLIVKNSETAFYLMEVPLFHFVDSELAESGHETPRFECDTSSCEFDNVKFWSLDNIPNLP